MDVDTQRLPQPVIDKLGDRDYAERVWVTMINNAWRRDDGSTMYPTFRAWGRDIAAYRGVGEDYLSFYCCRSDYETLDGEVMKDLSIAGWELISEREFSQAHDPNNR